MRSLIESFKISVGVRVAARRREATFTKKGLVLVPEVINFGRAPISISVSLLSSFGE
jgi:hypothetical protein